MLPVTADPYPPVPLFVAVWLAVAEMNSLWGEAVRTRDGGDEDCLPCHHCPECCAACEALAWLSIHTDLAAAVVRYAGRSWPWLDSDGLIRWKELARPWRTPCRET